MIEISLLKESQHYSKFSKNKSPKTKSFNLSKNLSGKDKKKSEPIFIETKKEVRIPVPVEIIVEKPV